MAKVKALKGLIPRGREVLRIEAEAVSALSRSLDERFEKAVHQLAACRGHVAVIGIGKSGLIGRKLASTLSCTGTPALYLHPSEILHGDLGMLTRDDLVLALSYSGETEEMRRVLPVLKNKGLKIIALTGKAHSRLARLADLALIVPVRREACPYNITPTASSTAMLALGDALAIVLMEKRGFGKEDFARLHPGGSLGKRLSLKVRDLMRKGRENPIIRENAGVPQALFVMTRTRVGAVSVADHKGKLIGFFTDGDLRRLVQRDSDALQRRISEVMTRGPLVAYPDQFAFEAAQQMARRKVDNLPVVDPRTKKPVGLLDERDLLAEGIG